MKHFKVVTKSSGKALGAGYQLTDGTTVLTIDKFGTRVMTAEQLEKAEKLYDAFGVAGIEWVEA